MDVFGNGRTWTELLQTKPTYWEKKRAIYNHATVYDRGFCLRHLGYCPYDTGALLRVGGPPCVDFSSAGLRRGENGPTAGTHIAYGTKAETSSTALVCFENVPACPEWFRADCLPSFNFEHVWTAPEEFGFSAMRRDRPGTFGAHIPTHSLVYAS